MKRFAFALAVLSLSINAVAATGTPKAKHAKRSPSSIGDNPSYVATHDEQAALITAIKQGTPSLATENIACTDVITVHTGGTMGSATAGLCMLGSSKNATLQCLNNMVGNVGSSLPPTTQDAGAIITTESALRQLIDNQCTGG